MGNTPLSEKILNYIKRSGLTASRIFENAGLDRMSGLEIINAGKIPDRDTLLRLAIALNINPEETQEILLENGYPTLIDEDGKDSYILFALKQGGDVIGLNEALEKAGFDTI